MRSPGFTKNAFELGNFCCRYVEALERMPADVRAVTAKVPLLATLMVSSSPLMDGRGARVCI